MARRPVLVFGLLALGGCGDDPETNAPTLCERDARAETYALGMRKVADAERLTVELVQSEPGPPNVGDVVWTLQIRDMENQPLDVAGVDLRVWMPDHGHGTIPSRFPAERAAEPGRFRAGPFNLHMGGYWEWTLTVETRDGATDQAKFAFCVEG